MLIPVSDPFDFPLYHVVGNGHTECVRLLIPISNPKFNNSYSLHLAVLHSHTACIDLLVGVSDASLVLHNLQREHPTRCWQYLEEKIAQHQHEMLNNEIAQHTVQTCFKNIRKI